MVGAFWGCYQNVGAWITSGVAGANIHAIMRCVGEIRIVGFNCLIPVIDGDRNFAACLCSAAAEATAATKLIRDCWVTFLFGHFLFLLNELADGDR